VGKPCERAPTAGPGTMQVQAFLFGSIATPADFSPGLALRWAQPPGNFGDFVRGDRVPSSSRTQPLAARLGPVRSKCDGGGGIGTVVALKWPEAGYGPTQGALHVEALRCGSIAVASRVSASRSRHGRWDSAGVVLDQNWRVVRRPSRGTG